jgi:hypothetical protein
MKMSKTFKRMLKSSGKKVQNVLMIGYSSEVVSDLVEDINTIFLVDSRLENSPKYKNVIHLRDTTFLSNVYSLDVILINLGYDINELQFMTMLLRRLSPIIFLNSKFNISKEYYSYFTKMRYEHMFIQGDYEVWKEIKR